MFAIVTWNSVGFMACIDIVHYLILHIVRYLMVTIVI